MKRTLSLMFLTLAVVVGLSMTAFAQNTILFNQVNANSNGSAYGDSTGLYDGALNGTPTEFVCDDSHTTITAGEWWTAQVTSWSNLTTGKYPGVNSGGVFNSFTIPGGSSFTPTQSQAYMMMGWLALQIFNNPTNAGGAWTADSAAIWALMDNPSGGVAGGPPGTLTDLDNAYTAVITGGLTTAYFAAQGLVIYTPESGPSNDASPTCSAGVDCGQEFIAKTPEPLSMVLMGTFLTLAGLGLGKKKLSS
jgi:hypothetical protein